MERRPLTPIQALGLRLTLRDVRTGRDRRGQLGTFRLDDLRATVDVALQRLTQQRAELDALCDTHGAAILIAEADLTPDQLELVLHAATDPRPTEGVAICR